MEKLAWFVKISWFFIIFWKKMHILSSCTKNNLTSFSIFFTVIPHEGTVIFVQGRQFREIFGTYFMKELLFHDASRQGIYRLAVSIFRSRDYCYGGFGFQSFWLLNFIRLLNINNNFDIFIKHMYFNSNRKAISYTIIVKWYTVCKL